MTTLRNAGITIAIFFASANARADEISDEEDACRGKSAGAACSGGTCQESECSRIDYSGEKPRSVKRSCLTCVAGAAKTAEPTKADVPAKADAPANTETPAKAEPAPANTETPAKAEPAPAKSSCAVEPGPLSFGAIPLGIVLVAIARRRSQRA